MTKYRELNNQLNNKQTYLHRWNNQQQLYSNQQRWTNTANNTTLTGLKEEFDSFTSCHFGGSRSTRYHRSTSSTGS